MQLCKLTYEGITRPRRSALLDILKTFYAFKPDGAGDAASSAAVNINFDNLPRLYRIAQRSALSVGILNVLEAERS